MENLKKKIQLLLNLYKSKNLFKAELLNKELINAHPQVVNLYNVLGLILSEQKKIDEAIMYYEKGIKIDPNYAVIYNKYMDILIGPIVYRLGHMVFIHERGVRFPLGPPKN